MYGSNGLISFLSRFFLGLDNNERKQFNYYFALKSHLSFLDKFDTVNEDQETDKPFEQSPSERDSPFEPFEAYSKFD